MEFYHVINRGVEKRRVFMEPGDYIRFIHDLYVFNDARSAPNYVVKERQGERARELLVRIHAFCLMPNHYHMLISPVREGGMSLFMRKLNMGYAKYFNEKYQRSGVLWQGTFKKQQIRRDAHFLYIPYYIHLNPLDLAHPEWRLGKVMSTAKALEYLHEYKWSSYLDYQNTSNVGSILYMAELKTTMGTPAVQEKEIRSIISTPGLAKTSTMLELPV